MSFLEIQTISQLNMRNQSIVYLWQKDWTKQRDSDTDNWVCAIHVNVNGDIRTLRVPICKQMFAPLGTIMNTAFYLGDYSSE